MKNKLAFKLLPLLLAFLSVLSLIACSNSGESADKAKPAVPVCNTYAQWGDGEFCLIEGELFAKGKDTNGFLADESDKYYKEWTKIRNIDRDDIVHFEICSGTLVYLTEKGEVFAMGNCEGLLAKYAEIENDSYFSLTKPQLICEKCSFVSLGIRFALFLKKDGSLWFMGESKNGQGARIEDLIAEPVKIAEKIAFIKAFGYTSAWITKEGTLYLCGDNSYGQIGNGHTGCGYPTRYEDIVSTPYSKLRHCVSFTVENEQGSFVTAETANGSIYTWGNTPNPNQL